MKSLSKPVNFNHHFDKSRSNVDHESTSASKRLQFLLKVSSILSSSMDYSLMLSNLAEFAVDEIADWCAIDELVDGELVRVVVSHKEPEKIKWAEKINREHPADKNAPSGIYNVLKTGKAEIYPVITDEILRKSAKTEEIYRILKETGISSAIIVPLQSYHKIFGTLSLYYAESGKYYNNDDFELACELGKRAGIALENSRLFEQSANLNKELHQRVYQLQQEVKRREKIENALFKYQQHLLLSEERLHLVLEAANLGTWYSDFPAQRITWNEQSRKIFGVPPEEEITPELYYNFVHPDDRTILREKFAEAKKNHSLLNAEYRIITEEGTIKYLRSVGKPFYDKSGKPLRFDGVTIDITNEKITQELIKKNKLRLDAALSASSTGTYNWDLESDVFMIDSNLSMIFGFGSSPTSLKTDMFLGLVHPESRIQVMRSLYDARDAGKDIDIQFRIITEDSSQRWIHNKGKVFSDENGKFIYTSGACMDITRMKNIEKELREGEERFRLITENSNDLICMINEKGKFLYISPSFEHHLGYSLDEFMSLSPLRLVHPNHLKLFSNWQNSLPSEFMFRRKDGKYIWIEGQSYSFTQNGEKVIVGIGRDITEQKNWREALEESEEKFRQIAENVNTVLFLYDFGGKKIEYVSPAFEKMWQAPIKEVLEDPEFLLRQIETEDLPEIQKHSKSFFATGKSDVTFRIKIRDGSVKWINFLTFPLFDNKGHLYRAVGLADDVTLHKKMLTETSRKAAELEAVIQSIPEAVFIGDKEGIKTANQYAESLFGILPDTDLNQNKTESDEKAIFKLALKGQTAHREISVINPNTGEQVILRSGAAPIIMNGELIGAVSISTNITEQKKAEEQIRNTLKEKEVLLKEIHHRVKNNLQIISSLLNLQLNYLEDNKIKEIFIDSQNRIKSMALIHEKLYQKEDFAVLDFREYVRVLVNNLVESYNYIQVKVLVEFNIEEVDISIDTAINLGLIINELVSNSLKHAFKPGFTGTIIITLKKESDGLLLRISDDGTGLPHDINFRETNSLGMQLIINLTEQLGGRIDLELKSGTSFVLRLPEAK